MSEKTALKVKKDHKTLEQTLQAQGQLEKPKPQLTEQEKLLLAEARQNPYNAALLYILMAENKENFASQQPLLQIALDVDFSF